MGMRIRTQVEGNNVKVMINLWGARDEDKLKFRRPLLPDTLDSIRNAIGNQQVNIEVQWSPRQRSILYEATDSRVPELSLE